MRLSKALRDLLFVFFLKKKLVLSFLLINPQINTVSNTLIYLIGRTGDLRFVAIVTIRSSRYLEFKQKNPQRWWRVVCGTHKQHFAHCWLSFITCFSISPLKFYTNKTLIHTWFSVFQDFFFISSWPKETDLSTLLWGK